MITQLHVKFFFQKKKNSISKQLNSIIIMKEMFNDFVVIQILEN